MVEFMALPSDLRQSHSGTVPNIIHPNGFPVNPGRSLEPFHKFFKHVSRKAPPAHTNIPSVASKRTTRSTPVTGPTPKQKRGPETSFGFFFVLPNSGTSL